MNRFSAKQTLSNITTGVRETVDFVSTKIETDGPLTTLLSTLAAAIFTPVFLTTFLISSATPTPAMSAGPQQPGNPNMSSLFSPPETADQIQAKFQLYAGKISAYCTKPTKAKPNPEYNEILCGMWRNQAGVSSDRDAERCSRAEERVKTDSEKVIENCTKAGYGGKIERCYDMVSGCNDTEMKLSEQLELEDEDPNQPEYCNRVLANQCPGIPTFNEGRDYRDEKRTAERDRKKAKSDLDEAMDEERRVRKEMMKQQREASETQQNAALEIRDAERAAAKALAQRMEGIAASQKEAFAKAQEEYTKMDAAYVNMRLEVRKAQDAVSEAEDNLQQVCRAAAQNKYNEAEKARLAKDNGRRKNRGTSVSGSASRNRTATNQRRAFDFAGYLNECLNGITPEGRGGLNAIATKKRAKATQDSYFEDQSKMMEAARSRMLGQLKDMEQDATNMQAKAVKDAEEQLTVMNEKRQLIAQQNQARIAEFNQAQGAAVQSAQEKIQNANVELMKTQREAALATTRETCAGKNARRSETVRDKVETGFGGTLTSINNLESSCRERNRLSCRAEEDIDKSDMCLMIQRVLAGTDVSTGKTPRKKPRLKTETDH